MLSCSTISPSSAQGRAGMSPRYAPDSSVCVWYWSSARISAEAQDRILAAEDAEISLAAQAAFEKRSPRFRVGAKMFRVSATASGERIEFKRSPQHEPLEAEAALLLVGIGANVEYSALEAVVAKLDRGHVATEARGATKVAGLYAIGDLAGAPWLAHKVSNEALRCVEHVARGRSEWA
jgi:dihydrolipoamide dehydrogenase